MSLSATALLFVATLVLERDSFSSLPAVNGNRWFYAGLLMNCSLAMTSNSLSISMTPATGPLSMQVSGNCLGIVGSRLSHQSYQHWWHAGLRNHSSWHCNVRGSETQSYQDPHSFVVKQGFKQPEGLTSLGFPARVLQSFAVRFYATAACRCMLSWLLSS